MNPTRQQIGELLVGDATLAGLAPGGVFYGLVTDQDAEPPFVIFHMAGGNEEWASGGAGIESDVWVVKGAGPSPAGVEEIDLRCQALLDDVALGGSNLFCRRQAPVEYAEVESGEVTYFRGSEYRVISDT